MQLSCKMLYNSKTYLHSGIFHDNLDLINLDPLHRPLEISQLNIEVIKNN